MYRGWGMGAPVGREVEGSQQSASIRVRALNQYGVGPYLYRGLLLYRIGLPSRTHHRMDAIHALIVGH